MMNLETEKLIKEIMEIIVQAMDPKQVILFGSQARGTPRAESDLDFLIVQDHPFGPGHTRRQQMAKLWRLLAHFPVSQDILVYTPGEVQEWRQSKNHVIARAVREGKVLYERA
jgi:predicted nucleotidyltransferase